MKTNQLPERLRKAITEMRRKPYPISDLIPLLSAAADALQARAQVQGEPVYWEWRHLGNNQFAADFGQWSEWKRVEARNPIFTAEDELRTLRRYIADGYKYELRALHTTPQPTQATQAEVTDERIIAIKKSIRAVDPTQPWGDTLAFARAILALRPERVPMTEWQPIETAPKDGPFLAVLDCGGDQTICTMRYAVAEAKNNRPSGEFIRERVTHWMPLPALPESPCNGITTQAKKEKP